MIKRDPIQLRRPLNGVAAPGEAREASDQSLDRGGGVELHRVNRPGPGRVDSDIDNLKRHVAADQTQN